MTIRAALLAVLVWGIAAPSAQTPIKIDTSKIGPAVGATVPPFSGVDQSGRTQTLSSIAGPKGAMLVFFRSSDW
jgi:hypothetical protein